MVISDNQNRTFNYLRGRGDDSNRTHYILSSSCILKEHMHLRQGWCEI